MCLIKGKRSCATNITARVQSERAVSKVHGLSRYQKMYLLQNCNFQYSTSWRQGIGDLLKEPTKFNRVAIIKGLLEQEF